MIIKTIYKKVLPVMLTVVMMVSTMMIGAYATGGNSLTIGTVNGKVGSTVSVPVNISLAEKASGIGFSITYDSNLTLDSTTLNTALVTSDQFGSNLSYGTNGAKFLINWTSNIKQSSGVLFYLNFTIKSNAVNGNLPVSISSSTTAMITDSKQPLGYLAASATNGAVCASGGTTGGSNTGDIVIPINDKKIITISKYVSCDISTANPSNIIATYIDSNGEKKIIPYGHYDLTTGKYIYTVPDSLANVKVTLEQAASVPPSTVPTTHWGYDAISYLYSRNILTDTDIVPDERVTRGDVVKLMAASTGLDLSKYGNINPVFSDVDANSTYKKYLNWASAAGIVNGYGDGTCNLNGEISREEVCAMLTRFLDYYSTNVVKNSPDIYFADEHSISSWSTPYVHSLTSKGLIKGVTTEAGTCFMPLNNMTNAEIATILQRILAS